MFASLRPTQQDIVLMHMQQFGTICRDEAIRYDIHNLPDRIFYLRKKGHRIKTVSRKDASYKLDVLDKSPLLTKQQFDQVMRQYGEEIGQEYTLCALRGMYSAYSNPFRPEWPTSVRNAINLNPKMVARFIAYNELQAEKDSKYQQNGWAEA